MVDLAGETKNTAGSDAVLEDLLSLSNGILSFPDDSTATNNEDATHHGPTTFVVKRKAGELVKISEGELHEVLTASLACKRARVYPNSRLLSLLTELKTLVMIFVRAFFSVIFRVAEILADNHSSLRGRTTWSMLLSAAKNCMSTLYPCFSCKSFFQPVRSSRKWH